MATNETLDLRLENLRWEIRGELPGAVHAKFDTCFAERDFDGITKLLQTAGAGSGSIPVSRLRAVKTSSGANSQQFLRNVLWLMGKAEKLDDILRRWKEHLEDRETVRVVRI